MDAINCKRCGAVLPPNASFCPRCGTVAARPSGQAVRERIRSVQEPVPVRAPVSYARKYPNRASTPRPEDKVPVQDAIRVCFGGLFLWALQLLFLFVKSIFLGVGSYGVHYSLYGFTREYGMRFMGILLLFLCLLGFVSLLIPLFVGRERSRFQLAAVPAGFAVLLCAATFWGIYRAGNSPRPQIGFPAWLFLLNGILILTVTFRAGQPTPAVKPAVQPREEEPLSETPPLPEERPLRIKPTPPRPTPSVPDEETIASLRRIALMHKQGLISDEEFARVKAECVARGWIRE